MSALQIDSFVTGICGDQHLKLLILKVYLNAFTLLTRDIACVTPYPKSILMKQPLQPYSRISKLREDQDLLTSTWHNHMGRKDTLLDLLPLGSQKRWISK